jgi:YVTN family beta-propeller protein
MALSADAKRLFIAASNADRIEVWDVATRRKMREIASGPDPERFVISPDGRTLYVASENDALISFFDVASGRVTRQVKVGAEPEGIGISPGGGPRDRAAAG